MFRKVQLTASMSMFLFDFGYLSNRLNYHFPSYIFCQHFLASNLEVVWVVLASADTGDPEPERSLVSSRHWWQK